MSRIAILLMILIFVSADARAQDDCVIGVYPNPEGTPGPFRVHHFGDVPTLPAVELDVYYVIRVEDFVRGVAWNRRFESEENSCWTVVGAEQHYDPSEQFLEVTENGFRMGLGRCYPGFGQRPIMVLRETLYIDSDCDGKGKTLLGTIYLEPNLLEDPEYPVYADCTDAATTHPCSFDVPNWVVEAQDSQSWGVVKATYR